MFTNIAYTRLLKNWWYDVSFKMISGNFNSKTIKILTIF